MNLCELLSLLFTHKYWLANDKKHTNDICRELK